MPTLAPVQVTRTQVDTARQSIVMNTPIQVVYTGVPVVRGLNAAVIDSVSGIVTLRWNRVASTGILDYAIFRTADSSARETSFVASTRDTFFVDTIPWMVRSTAYSMFTYWVGVRGKDSTIVSSSGASDTVWMPPYLQKFGILGPDTAFFGDTITLTISNYSYVDSGWTFYWHIGQPSIQPALGPSISFVLPDTLSPNYDCFLQAYGPGGDSLINGRSITTGIAWDYLASAGSTSLTLSDALVKGSEIWTLWTDSGSGYSLLKRYSDSGGLTVGDSLPFTPASRMAPLANEIYVAGGGNMLWHSSDGMTWSGDSANPIGSPSILPDSLSLLLFGTGERLIAIQCSGSSVLGAVQTFDGISWDSAQAPSLSIEGGLGFVAINSSISAFADLSQGILYRTSDFLSYMATDTIPIVMSATPSLNYYRGQLLITDTLGSAGVGLWANDPDWGYGQWYPIYNVRFSGPDLRAFQGEKDYDCVVFNNYIHIITSNGVFRSRR